MFQPLIFLQKKIKNKNKQKKHCCHGVGPTSLLTPLLNQLLKDIKDLMIPVY